MPTEAAVETGSFRDRDSRVVVAGGSVFRVLSERGAEDWRALADSELLEHRISEGSLVATEEAALADIGTDAAAPARRGRRGAAPRADPLRLLPVRVDLRDAP